MATYFYTIEFSDLESGECMEVTREYDSEMTWDEIWQDLVHGGDIQMDFTLEYAMED